MNISATVLLFFIFLTLKLTGTIAWSWWWVTCPLWFAFAFWMVVAGFGLLMAGTVRLLRGKR